MLINIFIEFFAQTTPKDQRSDAKNKQNIKKFDCFDNKIIFFLNSPRH